MPLSVSKRSVPSLFALALVPLMMATGCTTTTNDEDASAANDDTADSGGEQLSVDELCGEEPIRMAHVAGFGGNTWRQIAEAELIEEMSACENVTLEYAHADGDLQTYISLINSYSAQGYDAIVTYNDFGDQALSALRNAYEADTVVVPYIGLAPSGEVGVDYDAQIAYDFDTEGAMMVEWLSELLAEDGEIIFTGGLEGGSPSTQALLDGIEAKNEELGEPLTLASAEPIPSNWDPAFMQRAMSGVLAEYPDFDGWASDYGVSDIGGLRAMAQAGVPIPPLATSATDNALGCFWLEHHEDNPDFELLTLDGTTTVVRIAGRQALAAVNGLSTNEPQEFELPVFVDTANDILPECRDDLPPDADLSSDLTEEQLLELFG